MTSSSRGPGPAPLRVLSLGWGVQSWTLAAMAALGEIPPVAFAIHADTTHEAAGTYTHAAKWAAWLEERSVKVVTVQGKRPDVVMEEWSDSVMIPAFTKDRATGRKGQVSRQCTHDWKISPIRKYIRTMISRLSPGAVESVQGISFDEWQRMRTSDVRYITNTYPLVDMGISRAGCVEWLGRHHLDVPVKSACVFCPYHSIAVWKQLKKAGGSDWERAVAADLAIKDTSTVALRYLHPALRPLPEAIRIPEDHGATQLEMDLEAPCDGGYCFV